MRAIGWAWVLAAVLRAWPVAAQELCTQDPELTEAAAELLLAGNERPSSRALSEAVRAAGSDAVGVHALFVPAGATDRSGQPWLSGLRSRVDGRLHCGRADAAAGSLLIAFGRVATLDPIDDAARLVRGRLESGYRDAELVIETADAQLIRVGVGADRLSRGVELAPDLSLPLKIQLVARGPSGPRPVAERQVRARGGPQDPRVVRAEDVAAGMALTSRPSAAPARTPRADDVGADSAPIGRAGDVGASADNARRARAGDLASSASSVHPARAGDMSTGVDSARPARAGDMSTGVDSARPARAGDMSAGVDSARPARAGDVAAGASGLGSGQSGAELVERVLALRAERGRGGLRINRLLREAAHQHAAEVCATGKVAHELDGVGPGARLARAGLDARVLGEAIARADGTASAFDALRNSPSHLYTLLDPRFTDLGIGVAQDAAQKYCYVVLLCAWPRYVGKRAQ